MTFNYIFNAFKIYFCANLPNIFVKSQQKDTIITFFNILSAVILQCLLTETGKTLKISSLSEEFRKLKDLLMFLGAVTVFQGRVKEEQQLDR